MGGGTGNGGNTKTCISCKNPMKGPGAEHLGCALKHMHLSIAGWFFWLAGFIFPKARKAEERIKNRIMLDVIKSHIGGFIRAKNDKRKDEVVKIIEMVSDNMTVRGKAGFVMLEVERTNGQRTYVFQHITARLRVTDPPREKRRN